MQFRTIETSGQVLARSTAGEIHAGSAVLQVHHFLGSLTLKVSFALSSLLEVQF